MARQFPSLREALASKPAVFGGGLNSPSWFAVDAYMRAGFDFVGIDNQHTVLDAETSALVIQPLVWTGFPAIIRTNSHDRFQIAKVLDSGAEAVIIPMVDTPEQAAAIAGAAHYPPNGARSNGSFRSDVGALSHEERDAYGMVFPMIETLEGYNNAEAIISLEQVDGIYIGPSDLAIALNKMPPMSAFTTDTLKENVEYLASLCKKHGKVLGAFTAGVEITQMYVEWGVQIATIGTEAGFVAEAAGNLVRGLHGGEAQTAKAGY
jgi:4-hydroxy-2-oxoheptanedioate aldolase